MAGVNKVIILGNLGRDPELRYTQSQSAVCTLNIATTRAYMNRANERVEETEWHRVVVWGKQAEHCNQYLTKGRQVYVEGRLQTRSWDDKDGHKRYTTEIVADTVQFLGGGAGGERGRGGDGPRADRGGPDRGGGGRGGHDQGAPPEEPGYGDSYIPSDPGDDDIPF